MRYILFLSFLLLSACAHATPSPSTAGDSPTAGAPTSVTFVTETATATTLPQPSITITTKPSGTPSPSATSSATATTSATATPTGTPAPSPTFSPTPSPTPDPYAGLTVDDLATRAYGGGELWIAETLAANHAFTRTLVAYPSDALRIYGFMDVPVGDGPFPVIIVNHGYVDPSGYNTLAYTTRYADALAQAGYITIHPNFRNYAPSDEGPNLFRVGYAVDVLNLIATIREQAGKPGPLSQADPDIIGLWGHSMGGGITLRAVTVDPSVKAAVLYGSMSGDEFRNHEKILAWSNGQRGQEELETPEQDLQRISPIYHLHRIEAAISIHHGELDGTVPLEWSVDLCQHLEALEKTVECFTYPGQPHTFRGEGDKLFIQRIIVFFDRHLGAE